MFISELEFLSKDVFRRAKENCVTSTDNLRSAFPWEESPEGFMFWSHLNDLPALRSGQEYRTRVGNCYVTIGEPVDFGKALWELREVEDGTTHRGTLTVLTF